MTEAYVSADLSIEEMLDVVHSRDAAIVQLTNDRDVARTYSTNRLASLDTLYEKIHKAETYMVDAVDTGDADETILEGLSMIFDWETTKEVDVTVTAVFKGTITVPRGFNTDYLDEKFSVSCDVSGSNFEGYLDCDELNVEVN